jgi:hypothetical protein
MWLKALGAERTDFATGLTEEDIRQAVKQLTGKKALRVVRQLVGAADATLTCGIECLSVYRSAPFNGCQCNTCLSLNETKQARETGRAFLAAAGEES